MLMLPKSIQDWLTEGHLAPLMSDTVDTLDLSEFHARYDKDGPRNQPFKPAMMLTTVTRTPHRRSCAGAKPDCRPCGTPRIGGAWTGRCSSRNENR